jgi:hypothetical protein
MDTPKTANALSKLIGEFEINREIHQRTLDQCAERRKRHAVAAARGNSESRQELKSATEAEATAKSELATIDLALEDAREQHRAAVKQENAEAEARRIELAISSDN